MTDRTQRIHALKCMIMDGHYRQDLVQLCTIWTDLTPKQKDALIDEAYQELQEISDDNYHENQTRVLTHLWHVYFRACAAKDLSAQVASLGKIGQFSGLSERQPYKRPLPLPFTDEELDEAIASKVSN